MTDTRRPTFELNLPAAPAASPRARVAAPGVRPAFTPLRPLQLSRETPLIDDLTFNKIRSIAFRRAGICIADFKRNMVQRRVTRRMNETPFTRIKDYLSYVESAEGEAEVQNFINALTTNKTSFFRDGDHFDHLRITAIPAILNSKPRTGTPRIRVWSAGCSTGEEPWSIAMTIAQALGERAADVHILATDIDTGVLAEAEAGIYTASEIESVPPASRQRYLHSVPDTSDYEVGPRLRSWVHFRRLNLHEAWPAMPPFDLIFCRNVMIYFDKPSQRKLINRFANALTPGGLYYSGHSECLFGMSEMLSQAGRSIYRRGA